MNIHQATIDMHCHSGFITVYCGFIIKWIPIFVSFVFTIEPRIKSSINNKMLYRHVCRLRQNKLIKYPRSGKFSLILEIGTHGSKWIHTMYFYKMHKFHCRWIFVKIKTHLYECRFNTLKKKLIFFYRNSKHIKLYAST